MIELCKFSSVALTLAGLHFLPALPASDVVSLAGGGKVEGKVIKRTAEAVFVDVGYTILSIPAKEVKEIRNDAPEGGEPAAGKPTPAPESAAIKAPGAAPAEGAGSPRSSATAVPGGQRREGIYSTRESEPGSIQAKAREVAEGVVQVICPGKMGSGFIINEREGYVVTNYHVVEADQDIAVVIFVREEHDFRKVRLERIRIVAMNPFLDLALLKIEEDDDSGGARKEVVKLKKTFLAENDEVRVGDPVFAIGSPLGLERTVTEGIVSNARRAMGGLIYLQTSAPINPGNSGGPLFNERGEVVGITSRKVSTGESLGFAIPLGYLKDFLRHREAFAFDKQNPNTGIRYLSPPRKRPPERKQ